MLSMLPWAMVPHSLGLANKGLQLTRPECSLDALVERSAASACK
jgi:hypothetical protein